jgi:DNA ligase-1
MNYPTLFGKTKTGKIKEWDIKTVVFPNGSALIEMEHGLQGGKKIISQQQITEGKNIGKSNETNPYEQACSEAASRWKSQLDKGYAESIDDIKMGDERELFLPMLAQRHDKMGHKIKWPAALQKKYDGTRCLARKEDGKVTLWSRKGKIFEVPKEIIAELEGLLGEDEVLDGEIYKHEWRSPNGDPDFQRIISATKKWNKDTPLLEYHIYDVPDASQTFEERFVKSSLIQRIKDSNSSRIKIADTVICKTESEAMKIYEDWISGALMYEGAMVRNLKGLYMYDHRSDDLQKIKPLNDAEFKIIGGKEGTGADTGTVIFKCIAENGLEFEVRPTGTRELRMEYWNNLSSYLGQWLTVEFNGRTNDDKPRFPRGTKIRPSWDLDLRGEGDSPVVKPVKTTKPKSSGLFNPLAKVSE